MTAVILAMILLPLAMALLLLTPLRPVIPRTLGLAPVPGLLLLPAAWRAGSASVTLPGGWTLLLDQPGALMLGASTLLWIIGGLAASRWLAGRAGRESFALWWLLTLSGSLGVFVAGDVASFYALYALASLPAYGLIAFGGGGADRHAARITLAAALIGEAFILAAFVMMAAAGAGQGLAILLLVIGFGLKIGLVPLHGWMPMSYAAGPLVATAVLSGATSKAGIIGLVRFLPLDAAMPMAGGLLAAAGLFAAFYGAVLGLTQSNPRSVLAYSSISQLGQMAAVLGLGLAAGVAGAAAVVACYAAYHVLAKGGLFLMLGAREEGRVLPKWQFLLAGLTALGFAGLPLTGGALGKLALKDVTGSGAAGLLFALAAIGSTMLVLHFLRLLRTARGESLPAAAWIAAGLAASLLQWSLFAAVTGVSPLSALKPGALLDLSWPIAVGALLSWLTAAAGIRLPAVAPGDIGARAIGAVAAIASRAVAFAASAESMMRRWPVSSLAMAGVLVVLVLLLHG